MVALTREEVYYKCDKCAHEWRPRSIGRTPKMCPHCKSVRWNHIAEDKILKEVEKIVGKRKVK